MHQATAAAPPQAGVDMVTPAVTFRALVLVGDGHLLLWLVASA